MGGVSTRQGNLHRMLRAATTANGRRRLSSRGLGEEESTKLALILSVMCADPSWKHGLKLWDWKSPSPGRASHVHCRQHHHYLSTSSGLEAFSHPSSISASFPRQSPLLEILHSLQQQAEVPSRVAYSSLCTQCVHPAFIFKAVCFYSSGKYLLSAGAGICRERKELLSEEKVG